jgi:hypothetical protein
LRKHGIDPIGGLENLVWAPNVKGQHTLGSLQPIVDELKRLDNLGATRTDIVETLTKYGEQAAKR